MLNEFKEFALRGNVVDMAVGIIIGAAFSTIVRSLVDDVVMPPLGVLTGGVDFSNMFITLDGKSYVSLAQAREAGAPVIAFGTFINNVISFVIVAFVLFMVIKAMNKLRRKQEAEPGAAALSRRGVAAGHQGRPGQARRDTGQTGRTDLTGGPEPCKDFARMALPTPASLRT
jgi:large conductance mechanosensitive channel